MVIFNFIQDDVTCEKQQLKKPITDVSMLNGNKPKIDSAWHYRVDLKPLQSCTDYVPVYGDRPTAISDEKWPIPGRRRIDHLSKFGYSSHREVNSISPGSGSPPTDEWQSNEQNRNRIRFDNCYILGECKCPIHFCITLLFCLVPKFHYICSLAFFFLILCDFLLR